MSRTLKILNFLRIVDENALLSLTNIAVIVVLVKLAIAQDLDFEAVAALLAVLSGYGYKRFVNKDKKPQATVDEGKIAELEDKLNRVSFAVGFKKPVNK
jgi:hypothetical protein